jgi:8-amino-7-oxononanoate synthase
MMMPGSESRYQAFLEGLARDKLRRALTDIEPVDARLIRVAGHDYINFASNDYLALRFHPRLVARAVEWAERYGTGSGASRLVTGNLDLFAGIEAKVARLKGKPSALVMASGFQANAAVLAALFDRTVLGAEPLVFADRLNHASMHFGCKAAGIREIRYRHGDANHLAELLSQHQDDSRPRFILTESVFSMDGDVAPLAEIARLARAHDACLIVDDAHATGILGEGGRGLSTGADIVIGTFSKALGSFGAHVACSATMRDYLINRCSGLIYSTALPPPVLGAIEAALDLVPSLDAERAYVARLAARFRAGAEALGYDTGASATQIVPLIVGEPEDALGLSEHLRASGFWVTAIRPPTVPKGTARVRIAFTGAHRESDVDLLLETLASTVGGAPRKHHARVQP